VSKYQGTYRYKATREEIERVIRDLSWTVEEKGNSFGFSLRGLGAWRSVSDTNSSNLIYAKVGVNLWSWGERITVNLAKKTIKSEAAVLLDFGKNKENVNKLKERIDRDSASVQKASKAAATRERKATLESLIETLGDDNANVRRDASLALVEIGKPAVPSLIKALGHHKKFVYMGAGWALWKIGEPSVKALIKALKNDSITVRRQAATALGMIGDTRAVEPLIKALEDSSEGVRRDAATSLAFLGHELQDERVREGAARTLEDLESIRKDLGVTDFAHSESEILREGLRKTDTKTRLKEAKELFDEGLIDEEEYKRMKKDILRSKK
jgi:HEAT repeat protein